MIDEQKSGGSRRRFKVLCSDANQCSMLFPLLLPPVLPLRRLGSFSQFSERPIFSPKSTVESLSRLPLRRDESRFTLLLSLESSLRFNLSRSRLSTIKPPSHLVLGQLGP